MEKQIVVFNGSYREYGVTSKILKLEADRLMKEYDSERIIHIHIPDTLMSCRHCDKRSNKPFCTDLTDSMPYYIKTIENSERVIFGSPVYLDMPSAKMVAFLTRLNCIAEMTKREFFRGKKAHFVSVGYCSGTKAVIRTMMGACEMLGFTMEGRCSKEYILLWKDKKIRGGMGNEDIIYLND